MRISVGVQGPIPGGPSFQDEVAFVQEAEKLGVFAAWTVEGWGADAVTPLAYLAAQTETIRLGTGIMQLSARVPSMIAMTARTLAELSDNRFLLGLGVSGAQVVEGLHGVSFEAPLTRLRETVDVIRLSLAGEKIDYQGDQIQVPLPGGRGRSLRLGGGGSESIPIYLATLGKKSLEYTGAAADGWIGTTFCPEHADALLPHIEIGAKAAGRTLTDLDIGAGAARVDFGSVDELVDRERMGRAFTIAAMGSRDENFYADSYVRAGWGKEVEEVQSLWHAGRRDEAAKRVPAEMILQTNLFGDEADIRHRIRAYIDAGVTTLKVSPAGDTLDARVSTLGRLMSVVRAESA
ncbi:MAG: LLM class flavin-dependent oxidoreductase [Pseudomonadales bacterium]|nr:LLM class flavin-dependent oxidoreductase [Pseudomonadales bacterium]